MKECEIIVLIIMTVLTLINCYQAGSYLLKLHKDMEDGIFIANSLLHSQQHFAIVGMLMLLSIVMFINTFNGDVQSSFLEHLFYNLTCILIIYPHLFNEK